MDVFAPQIAVTIEDAAFLPAALKELGMTIVKQAGKILDRFERWARKERAGEAFRLRKVLVGADPKLCDASPFLDFGRRLLRPIKSTELLSHPVQVR